VLWASFGFAMANLSLLLGAYLAGKPYEFDLRLLLGFGVVLAAVISTPRLLASNTRFQITFDLSAESVASDAERLENTRAVAARLHDTLLANLAVIGSTKPGMLQDPVREAIENQLALFETSDFGRQSGSEALAQNSSTELEQLMAVISGAEARGLLVNLGGKPSAINSLTSERVDALNAALAQCLTNVHLHSGQNAVEVVILPAGENLAITIIDGGSGFNVDQVPEDRMGLKLSVRDRIEQCGGRVRVWSNEGQGTAVMLQLPVSVEASDA
jgi:signal transduction histidine kinase